MHAAQAHLIADMQDANPAFSIPKPQCFPISAASKMNHNSLALRQSGNLSRPLSTPADRQGLSQVATGIDSTLDNNAPMFHPNLTYNDLYRMASETVLMAGRKNLMDPGMQSLEDIDFFLQNLYYPARDTSDVRILIGFGIRTHG